MKETILQLDRAQLTALESHSDSKHSLVALHGWLDNAASFAPLFERLRSDMHQLLIDLPGHGKSDHRGPGEMYHLVDYVLDIARVVDQLVNEGQTVHLLGHSMGGVIACMVAAAMPKEIESLIMLDSLGPLVDDEDQVLAQLRKSVRKATKRGVSNLSQYPSIDEAVDARMKGFNPVTRESAELLVRRGTLQNADYLTWSTDPRLTDPSMIRLSESQARAILSGVESPCLLIGGKAGYLEHYQGLSKRQDYIKELTLEFVDGGHHFHMDGDVAKAAQLIDSFLTQHMSKA